MSSCLESFEHKIQKISRPHFQWPIVTDEMKAAVMKGMDNGFSLESRRKMDKDLEESFKSCIGVDYVVAVNSGTSAILSIFHGIGIQQGDEVIVPVYTYFATASPLIILGATPVFTDCGRDGNIDPQEILKKVTPKTKAVMITHQWGIPCEMDAIIEICQENKLALLEDCSRAHGAKYKGKNVGTFGIAAAFSLQANKIISGVEGGLVVTNDETIYYKTLLLSSMYYRSADDIPENHPLFGFHLGGFGLNHKIHPLSAVIATQQLTHLSAWITQKCIFVKQIEEAVNQISFLEAPSYQNSSPAWYAFVMQFIPGNCTVSIEEFLQELHKQGLTEFERPGICGQTINSAQIFTNPSKIWPKNFPDFQFKEQGPFPVAENFQKNAIKLPVWVHASDQEVVAIYIEGLLEVAKKLESTIVGSYSYKMAERFKHQTDVSVEEKITALYDRIAAKNLGEYEFLQAIKVFLSSLKPVFVQDERYLQVFETIAEPERVIMFRVPWLDDSGRQRVNRGYRVQFSSALGPFAGGVRFHSTINLGIIKFFAFEQIFKNALTGLPMGGAKGGSDFDPQGKSDNELFNFCASFMNGLYQHLGPSRDVLCFAGGRHVGYLFGQYKRLTREFNGGIVGKDEKWGGSALRFEAGGYGLVYFAEHWCADNNFAISGAQCAVSGSGNMAQYAIQKLIELGAIPLTASDSSGYVLEPNGFTTDKLTKLMMLKNRQRERISKYCEESPTAQFFSGKKPWGVKEVAIAFPCATQNEIDEEDAKLLKCNGCKLVAEGANMPSTPGAQALFMSGGIALLPGKAANAGGIIRCGLEISQNAMHQTWPSEEVTRHLKETMKNIYHITKNTADAYGVGRNFVDGANIAAFKKVADAVIEQGCV